MKLDDLVDAFWESMQFLAEPGVQTKLSEPEDNAKFISDYNSNHRVTIESLVNEGKLHDAVAYAAMSLAAYHGMTWRHPEQAMDYIKNNIFGGKEGQQEWFAFEDAVKNGDMVSMASIFQNNYGNNRYETKTKMLFENLKRLKPVAKKVYTKLLEALNYENIEEELLDVIQNPFKYFNEYRKKKAEEERDHRLQADPPTYVLSKPTSKAA